MRAHTFDDAKARSLNRTLLLAAAALAPLAMLFAANYVFT